MSEETNGNGTPSEEKGSAIKEDDNSNINVTNQPQMLANIIEASKDGEIIKFTVQSKEIKTGENCEERGHVVVREYEDFQWLDNNLRSQINLEGVIVPPLMVKPKVTAHATEMKSKKQLGAKTSSMLGDEFTKECRSLEKYLQLLLNHPAFCKDENLRKFLVDEELPARVKVKKSLLDSLSKTVGEVRFHSHRDVDKDFQKKRDFVNQYSLDIKICSEAFHKLVSSEHKMASDFGTFATTVTNAITDGTNSTVLNKVFCEFAQCLDHCRDFYAVMGSNSERTFGFNAELYLMFMESVKSMFLLRTQKLVKFENAIKCAEKAKPQNKEELEEARKTSKEEFEEISEKSEKEFARFQRQRVLAFQSTLVKFTESQISNARDSYMVMRKLLSNMKSL